MLADVAVVRFKALCLEGVGTASKTNSVALLVRAFSKGSLVPLSLGLAADKERVLGVDT